MINLNILKQSTIVHLCFAISYFTSGLILTFIQAILYFGLKPLNKSLYRKINYYLSYSFYSQLVFMSEWWSNTKLSVYIKKDEYDKYYGKEHGYLLMNHSYEIDWLMGWHFCDAIGVLGIVCGDLHKISQSVTSKIVAKTSAIIALKITQFIKFPTLSEQTEIKQLFCRVAGFPGVLGCIDCTHIPIKNPDRRRGEVFRNRKGWFSINVQLVCGPNMEIYDIVARWPGSVHDSRIFINSRCSMRFQTGELSGILIGDSGYAQTSYMFTPVTNPQTQSEIRYNRAHISTRNVIERLNGVWKRRFACLSRKLQNNLVNTCNIIVACAVLHNISVLTREDDIAEPNENLEEVPVPHASDNERGSLIRTAFIIRHF